MLNPIPGVYDFFNKEFMNYDNVFLFSDPHFRDEELAQAFPERPSADEMIKYINSKAGKDSLVIFLGDIGDTSYVRKLRATTWLLMGNHDQGISTYRHATWSRIYDIDERWTREKALADAKERYPNCDYQIWEEYDVCHPPFHYWKVVADNGLFDQVFQGPLQLGEKLILSHEPIPLLTWAKNLHGHEHNPKSYQDKYHFNICCDAYGYKLFNLTKEIRDGFLSDITSLHRSTIEEATSRKEKKEYEQ